jgi:hypothetical protein
MLAKSADLGIFIAIALAIHNIPEGIAVSVPIYYATSNRNKAFVYSFVSTVTSHLSGDFATKCLPQYPQILVQDIHLSQPSPDLHSSTEKDPD